MYPIGIFLIQRELHYNPENPLWADTTGSESSIGSYNVDLLSNGFKIRTSSSQVNLLVMTLIPIWHLQNFH